MKFTHRIFVSMAILAGISTSLQAQEEIDKLFQEGVQDGKYLLTGYLNPFMKCLGTGLNQGWYNTAEVHKVPGFDLTITANVMYIPDKDMFYHVDNSKLSTVALEGGSGNAPTMFGPDTPPTYRILFPDGTPSTETLTGPPGLNLKEEINRNILPVPMAHLGIGLPKGFDLKIRWAPPVNIGEDGTFKIFGIGVMHNVKQYIPGLKLLPFDLSGFVGYTSMKIDLDMSGDYPGENQRGVFKMSSTTIQGLISKKFSVVTFYGGLGYNIAKSRLAVEGTYNFNYESGDTDTTDPGETNPAELKFSASGPRATAGIRLKLAILTLHADYTLQKYNALTIGLGFSVR